MNLPIREVILSRAIYNTAKTFVHQMKLLKKLEDEIAEVRGLLYRAKAGVQQDTLSVVLLDLQEQYEACEESIAYVDTKGIELTRELESLESQREAV